MGLIDDIKNQVKKSGSNKGKILYFKSGVKARVRFLQDMEEGISIPWHDNFTLGIDVPCQETFGRECEHCGNEELRHRSKYVWSVWDVEAKEVKLMVQAVNNCSPIPGLIALYDAYGNITDRDYVITKTGASMNVSYGVVPMDKVKFRNDKAKAFSASKTLQIIDDAFPNDTDSSGSSNTKKNSKGKSVPDDDDDDQDSAGYSEMTAKQLYQECVDRDIEVPARKPAAFYIKLLEENDAEKESEDDWGDDEESAPDYSEMSAKELFDLCKERDIKVEIKKPAKYYIEKLEAADGESDEEDAPW